MKSLGLPFREGMDVLVDFLHHEGAHDGHGGYCHDFPILLANCMKHNCDFHFTALAECVYVDSMLGIQNSGYQKPDLDAPCQDLNTLQRIQH